MTDDLPDTRRLQWPAGWPRTDPRHRQRALFKTGLGAAARGLEAELRLMGATNVVISTGVPARRDGLPRSGYEPEDPGVAVYWTVLKIDGRSQQHAIACDVWDRVRDNLHAVELSVGAIRALARWGASEIVHRAFSGFAALPPGPGGDWWREVLDVRSDATLEQCEEAFRLEAFSAHPDRGGDGGSPEKMQQLNAAIAEARRVLR